MVVETKSAQEKQKTRNLWIGIGCLALVAAICVCAGLLWIGSNPVDIAGLDYNNPAPGYQQIRSNMKSMTEVQWDEYLSGSVKGKTAINWVGWVSEVSQKSAGVYNVRVDMDPPSEELSVSDVEFDMPAGQAGGLMKDQQITFSGRIRSVIDVLGSCQVDLDKVELR